MSVHIVYRVVRQTVGWVLIVLGVLGIFLPFLPQIPFLAVGALLLAPYVRVFRRLSAWVHKKYPKWRGPLRRFRVFKRPLGPHSPGVSR